MERKQQSKQTTNKGITNKHGTETITSNNENNKNKNNQCKTQNHNEKSKLKPEQEQKSKRKKIIITNKTSNTKRNHITNKT